MPATLDLKKAVIEQARWYILVALDAGRPLSVSEDILLRTLNDSRLQLTLHELRRELDYLRDRRLLDIEGEKSPTWAAGLTQLGVDVVEYTVDVKPGIARPPKWG